MSANAVSFSTVLQRRTILGKSIPSTETFTIKTLALSAVLMLVVSRVSSHSITTTNLSQIYRARAGDRSDLVTMGARGQRDQPILGIRQWDWRCDALQRRGPDHSVGGSRFHRPRRFRRRARPELSLTEVLTSERHGSSL